MMMKGNLLDYICLQLSFFGIMLLVVLSFGVAILWVQPYMTQTITLFYYELTGQLDKIEVYKHTTEDNSTTFEQFV